MKWNRNNEKKFDTNDIYVDDEKDRCVNHQVLYLCFIFSAKNKQNQQWS